MTRKEIIKNLEEKNFDCFGDDLYLELQMFPQGYKSIEEMIEDQTPKNLSGFLVEDFPERYQD